MLHEEKYETLARLTGFPNLNFIVDPKRLESLVELCAFRKFEPGTPLRHSVALKEYREAAMYRLESPEDLLDA